jgi:hypothetical protein
MGNVYNQTASDREPIAMLVEPSNRIVTAGWAINATTTNYDYILAGYNANGSVHSTIPTILLPPLPPPGISYAV